MKKILLILLLFPVCGWGQIITTVAGGATGHGGYWGDGGPATAAELDYFAGLLVDHHGNIFISGGNRILKVDALTGFISTIAGTGVAGYNGDSIPAATALLNIPECISFDASENIYVYDYGNNRIRKIDGSTGIITTYAGNGSFGSSGDGTAATSASIDGGDMAWDASGNLYITSTRKIRKIDPLGIISIFVGNGLSGITGEGVPATSTYIAEVRGIAVDNSGNFFLADSTRAIRKIDATTGLITLVAGTGDNLYVYSGDGLAATTCHIGVFDISIDDTGNIYIADQANSRIEKVNNLGIINTIAGSGIAGFSGDGTDATGAKISHPENVVLDRCGNVYIADFNNKRVRKVTYHPSCDVVPERISSSIIKATVSLYPNPANDELTIQSPQSGQVAIYNMPGQMVLQQRISSGQNKIDISRLPGGVYLVRMVMEDGSVVTKRVVKE